MAGSITSRAASNPKGSKLGTAKDFENVRLEISPSRALRHTDSQ